jgi:NADPH-dependent curcumin reductase CurA
MAPRSTLVWTLAKAPHDVIPDDAFVLSRVNLPAVQDGEILVQMIYLSNDPAQRAWIQNDGDESRSYTKPVRQGDVMHAYGIAKVLESGSAKYQAGQLVRAAMGWRQYHVMPESAVMPIL